MEKLLLAKNQPVADPHSFFDANSYSSCDVEKSKKMTNDLKITK